MERIIFHIDVNSAFLSWTAAKRIKYGLFPDLREIPAVIGGREHSRTGIVLAKSISAKKFGIQTGEPLYKAKEKCPDLKIVHPDFKLYNECSKKMIDICTKYSPFVEQFSVDELFLDYTNMEYHFGSPINGAKLISEAIKKEMGVTVNIGISNNKLLAKMASDFEKPDKIHTLFPDEIQSKMWPLPVSELFMVGRKTEEKLKNIGLYTIGDVARCDRKFLRSYLKEQGELTWCYANGIDISKVNHKESEAKSIGNGATLPKNITTSKSAYSVLLGLAEKVGERLRKKKLTATVISVSLKSSDFKTYSHQKALYSPVSSTYEIFHYSKEIFNEMWNCSPIRAITITLTEFQTSEDMQCCFFTNEITSKALKTDNSIDDLRAKYGHNCIMRASLINTHLSHKITNAQDTTLKSNLN
ncbi:MAG: DNA polymerase IV [Clostridia bacterium]|nr:DNA polymerase IV [Clostridia bacterium]